MAINFNDQLERILDDTSHNRRHDIWRWLQLKVRNTQSSETLINPECDPR